MLGARGWITFDRGVYTLRSAPGLHVDVDALLAVAAEAERAARREERPDASTLAAWQAVLLAPVGVLGEGTAAGDWLVAHQDRVQAAHATGIGALGRLYTTLDASVPSVAMDATK